ncbi:MAG: alpha/beta hydrolase [Candidatus Rokuibacteriota bacterium]|nr:MAG: alpha/beta hydrolase [Candidatus Rokubacteria bacterium]
MISEQPLVIDVSRELTLEARLSAPPSPGGGIVICHPHPLYGGDMDNPVVVRVQEVCAELGIATLRFNFRGVGGSTGSHAGGIGEQEDAVAALDALAKTVGGRPLALAGYSFGARISALVGCRDPRVAGMVLIAPPLAMYDFGCLEGRRVPTLMVAGTADSYCPVDDFRKLEARFPWVETVAVEGADHFFFGKVFPLGQAVAEWTRRHFPERGAG